MLFSHGGGYIFGHIDLFDGPVSRYVSASGAPMLSVEYRRSPEHPFPTPLEDAYTALRWLNEHATELGVDPDRTRASPQLEPISTMVEPSERSATVMLTLTCFPIRTSLCSGRRI